MTEKMRLNPLTNRPSPTRETPYSKGQWKIVECLETGMVYLENPPRYEDLIEDFAWETTFEKEVQRRREEEPIVARLSGVAKKIRRKYRKQERVAKTVTRLLRLKAKREGQSVPYVLLDVGCGTGIQAIQTVTRLKEEFGVEVTPCGVEISRQLAKESHARMAAYGGNCIQASAVEGIEGIAPNSLDVVVLSSYLEHEVNPLGVLKAVQASLKPGGYVAIRLPNYACWNRKIRQKKWCGFRYPDHVNYFTPTTLKRILEAAGLKIYESPLMERLPTNDNISLVATK